MRDFWRLRLWPHARTFGDEAEQVCEETGSGACVSPAGALEHLPRISMHIHMHEKTRINMQIHIYIYI